MCGGVAYKIIVDISKKEMSYRKIFVFFVVLFFVQILIFNNYFHKNPQASARSFMSENIDSDKLVVLDERMYTLFGYWIANDKNPVTLINFVRLNNFYKNSTNIIEDYVYFVKCASFDCGWGTGKIEGINTYLLEVSLANFGEDWDIMAEFKDEGYDQGYAVFKAKIKYPYEVKRDAYLTNNFYYHSLSWKNPLGSFDHYMPQNKFEIIIHYSAFSILILLTIISIILFFVPLVLIYYYNKRMPNI